MKQIDELISSFASIAWGLPLVLLLIGGGIYLMIKLRFLPFRYMVHAIDLIRGRHADEEDTEGQLSHLQALSTALASTIGMGNIAGVAVAIVLGGPGAIFWMWVSGIIGMNTKFFTCSLSVMYRGRDSAGQIQGGPMYFIINGLGKKWKPLAMFFALSGLIGALPVFNVNQLTQAIRDIVLIPHNLYYEKISELIIGVILVSITAVVVLGGIKRISRTSERLVPFMVVLYFVVVVSIFVLHIEKLPYYIGLIFTEAFYPTHYKGNPFWGGMLGGLILLGIRRGAFSNEAGIGTAPLAHGASRTNEPIKEGLVAMMGPLVDTLIVCTLTALSILITDTWQLSDSNGVSLTSQAFESAFPGFGSYLLLCCIAVFSISSLFSFSYYGTKCLSFLLGAHRASWYNYFYLLSVLVGAMTTLDMMINLIDGFYALMAIPTMIATLILAPRVVEAARRYFQSLE